MFERMRPYPVVLAACLVLAALVGVLGVALDAQAKKPGGGGGKPEAIHGCVTFRDRVDDLEYPDDRVRSDGGGSYCSKQDAQVGLGDFFGFKVKLERKTGFRSVVLDFSHLTPEQVDPAFLPASEDGWTLWVKGTLAQWRSQPLNEPVLREGDLHFGVTGKDEASVSYGIWGGDWLTVTRIADDVWTIESFPEDIAAFYRQDLGQLGSGSMPFMVTYDGRTTP